MAKRVSTAALTLFLELCDGSPIKTTWQYFVIEKYNILFCQLLEYQWLILSWSKALVKCLIMRNQRAPLALPWRVKEWKLSIPTPQWNIASTQP